jgi:hypothetical protein
MKLTVLDQYAQGVRHYDHEIGERLRDQVERLKWSLWHEHLEKALGKIEDIASSMAPLEETASQLDFVQLRSIAERFREALQQCAWDLNQISLLLGR